MLGKKGTDDNDTFAIAGDVCKEGTDTMFPITFSYHDLFVQVHEAVSQSDTDKLADWDISKTNNLLDRPAKKTTTNKVFVRRAFPMPPKFLHHAVNNNEFRHPVEVLRHVLEAIQEWKREDAITDMMSFLFAAATSSQPATKTDTHSGLDAECADPHIGELNTITPCIENLKCSLGVYPKQRLGNFV